MSAAVAAGCALSRFQSVSVVPISQCRPHGMTNSTLFSVRSSSPTFDWNRSRGTTRCTPFEARTLNWPRSPDHRLGLVGPDAGRVDDLLGEDLEVLVGLEVVRLHADDALADLDEALDLDAARDVGAVEAGGAGEVGDVAGVVDLRVPVGETAGEGIGMQRRGRAQQLALGEVAVMRHAGRAQPGVAEQVVERHAGADVEALEHRLRQRVEEAHRLHQVRRDALQQQAALDERLAHQPEVELLEVADAAVHELASCGCWCRTPSRAPPASRPAGRG